MYSRQCQRVHRWLPCLVAFVGYTVETATFPDNRFLTDLLCPFGLIRIVLGQFELCTETTRPPVTLVGNGAGTLH